MASDVVHIEFYVASYLKNQGYVGTLEKLLAESPYLSGHSIDEINERLSTADFERLAQDLRGNEGVCALLTRAIRQMESAVSTMKHGLRLTNQTPSKDLTTNQSRFYDKKSTRPTLRNQKMERQEQQQEVQRYPPQIQIATASFAAATTGQLPRTPRQSSQRKETFTKMILPTFAVSAPCAVDVQIADQLLNTTTPTRRQLFASPNKRKTPNPKHQLTPRVDRDLLEDVLKQCAISPSAWDRRVSDSALPQQLAAVINNAIEHSCNNTPRKIGYAAIKDEPSPIHGEEDIEETDKAALISGALHQIHSNPDFFQSLEQLFAAEYDDPDTSAIVDEVNRFDHLRTPEPSFLQSDSDATPCLTMAFDVSSCSSTVGQLENDTASAAKGKYRKILPTSSLPQQTSPRKAVVRKKLPIVFHSRPLYPEHSDYQQERREPPRKKVRQSLTFAPHSSSPCTSASFPVATEAGMRTPLDSNFQIRDGRLFSDRTPKDAGNQEIETPSSGTMPEKNQLRSLLSADMVTPDRIDALMKRLHKAK